MAHTPGPWKISPLDGRTCGPSRLLVCDGTEVPQLQAVAIVTLRTGETDANARLIAAAPELLRALKDALVEIETNGDSIGAVVDVLESQGRAAIAKAEGR